MALVQVKLVHTDKKPQTTIIQVNGVDLFEVKTHGSDLTFVQEKVSKASGRSNNGEYLFDVEWTNER